MHEAKTYLSQLVNEAKEGNEILIARAGVPVARLVPLRKSQPKVKFGILKGKIKLSKNYDAPLTDDELALFEGEE